MCPFSRSAAAIIPNPISRHPYLHPSSTFYISPKGVSFLHVFFDLASSTPGAHRWIVPRVRLYAASSDALAVLEGT
ncbi:hypothetical protein GUJ93_ZPchr0012g19277 [Zizania palustris]|uniref:Uncharacterized protein n=1 Tax=Zizania palustris TaxID=103762 RepID=A0A8J6BVB8_ZIZPA|nr:hypothetical protein GUJ93_ZPchr0012g19277 [Zizania palustris]